MTAKERKIVGEINTEIRNRLQFLVDVGLDYLTLARRAPTLSGGEMQRIRLAAQVGSGLCGVLYVLDEPTIGLHPRDNKRLLDALKRLRDLGNTLLVVEHDREVVSAADQLLDFGPGAGRFGGQIVARGTPEQVAKKRGSVTGPYLSGKKAIPVPINRRMRGEGERRKAEGGRRKISRRKAGENENRKNCRKVPKPFVSEQQSPIPLPPSPFLAARRLARNRRRTAQQSQEYRRLDPAGHVHGRYRHERQRKELAHRRRAVPNPRPNPPPRQDISRGA